MREGWERERGVVFLAFVEIAEAAPTVGPARRALNQF